MHVIVKLADVGVSPAKDDAQTMLHEEPPTPPAHLRLKISPA